MSKFIFIEKLSELEWWIEKDWPYVFVDSTDDICDKRKLRRWIEENCQKEVVVFGRTAWPNFGERNYGEVISGDGSIDVYFEDYDEAMFFKLVWGTSEEKCHDDRFRFRLKANEE